MLFQRQLCEPVMFWQNLPFSALHFDVGMLLFCVWALAIEMPDTSAATAANVIRVFMSGCPPCSCRLRHAGTTGSENKCSRTEFRTGNFYVVRNLAWSETDLPRP